jgi:hypothetical protein
MRVLLVILLFQSFSGLTAPVPSDKHWSWQPLENSRVPAVTRHSNPIDAFIVAHLKTKGLALAPRADRRTLIRRLTFNLTGLPPSPEQTTSFLADTSADAYEKLVDQLLASPAYGEHWAQHWLDLARFAETDGFEHDKVRPNAWRYRDWVIQALNNDLPYNRFVQLQIAGDQLQSDDPEGAIATGFLLAGQDMPDINLVSERRHMVLNEMTATVGSAFLGLTLGCAQCHEHKSDPISQKEFYQMRAFFESDLQLKERKVGKITVRVMQVGEQVPTHVMTRGDFRRAGEEVQAAYPAAVNPAGARPTRGQRHELGAWLTRPDNALALRVAVNRLWLQHFGRPLAVPEDFGTQSLPPTHPQLLDWLAAELPRRQWSLKAMHRLILTSATWCQISRNHGHDSHWVARLEKDPDNLLWSRQARRRLTGEMLRDTLLAVSGSLSDHKGGPGVRPPLPKEITSTLLKNQWPVSKDEKDHRRRSIYLFARRNLRLPIFELFDRPALAESCTARKISTTAPQSLALLNSDFTRDAAARLARVAAKKTSDQTAQFTYCYLRLLNRAPNPVELGVCTQLVSASPDPKQGLAELCLALINLNEFLYLD